MLQYLKMKIKSMLISKPLLMNTCTFKCSKMISNGMWIFIPKLLKHIFELEKKLCLLGTLRDLSIVTVFMKL